jgi:hypothetical protein
LGVVVDRHDRRFAHESTSGSRSVTAFSMNS